MADLVPLRPEQGCQPSRWTLFVGGRYAGMVDRLGGEWPSFLARRGQRTAHGPTREDAVSRLLGAL